MEKIFVADGKIGKGVYARIPIEARESIFYVTGQLIDFASARNHPTGENTFQIGKDEYVYPLYPSRYLNHSCSPNAGLKDDIQVIALRQISPGEEITFDYSTTMLERDWELACRCGAPNCRGTVRDFDFLPKKLQSHYLSLEIVQSFIVAEIGAKAVV